MLASWFLVVAAIAAVFRNWWILEIYILPSIAFVWMIRNESRLKGTKSDLKQLSPGIRIHFFLSVPLLIGIRLIFGISETVHEADAWRLTLAMSFGLAWAIVIVYAFAIVARKRSGQKDGKSPNV